MSGDRIEGNAMAGNGAAHGMVGVDKMGAKILFIDPATYETQKVLDGFQRTVHELLVVPETGRAYVPIYGDGIHGRNPNPGHTLCVIDLKTRSRAADIDLRPYIAPHTLKLGPDGRIYITCENTAVGRDHRPNDERSRWCYRFRLDQCASPHHRARRPAALHGERRDGEVSVIDLPHRKLLGKIKTPQPLAGITILGDGATVTVVSDQEPVLFLIDTKSSKSQRNDPPQGCGETRPDRPLQPRLADAWCHKPQQRHRELDRPVLP
jgi:DNA-binding beta-propeller fold protein YncE